MFAFCKKKKKRLTKSNFGKEGFTLADHLESTMEGIQGRNLEAIT